MKCLHCWENLFSLRKSFDSQPCSISCLESKQKEFIFHIIHCCFLWHAIQSIINFTFYCPLRQCAVFFFFFFVIYLQRFRCNIVEQQSVIEMEQQKRDLCPQFCHFSTFSGTNVQQENNLKGKCICTWVDYLEFNVREQGFQVDAFLVHSTTPRFKSQISAVILGY